MPSRVSPNHAEPCEGLREIQRIAATQAQEIETIREWQRRANGNIHDAVVEIGAVKAALAESRVERAVQMGEIRTQIAGLRTEFTAAMAVQEKGQTAAVTQRMDSSTTRIIAVVGVVTSVAQLVARIAGV